MTRASTIVWACASISCPPGLGLWDTFSEVVPWLLGIGVTIEKDVAGRGQGASQRQLFNAGIPQEDREQRVREQSGARLAGASQAEWTSLKLLTVF